MHLPSAQSTQASNRAGIPNARWRPPPLTPDSGIVGRRLSLMPQRVRQGVPARCRNEPAKPIADEATTCQLRHRVGSQTDEGRRQPPLLYSSPPARSQTDGRDHGVEPTSHIPRRASNPRRCWFDCQARFAAFLSTDLTAFDTGHYCPGAIGHHVPWGNRSSGRWQLPADPVAESATHHQLEVMSRQPR
jgi:hypothetical protein